MVKTVLYDGDNERLDSEAGISRITRSLVIWQRKRK